MSLLRQIKLGVNRLTRGINWLPEYLDRVNEFQRELAERDEREAERLDRLRNPHKYRGR
jgi:hypothetical protein